MKAKLLIALALTQLLISCGPNEHTIVIPPPTEEDEEPTTPVTPPEEPETPTPPVEPSTDYIIVGYATYWDKTMPDPTYLTHINYSFAHIKSDFESLDVKSESRLAQIAALKTTNPGLKVLLSVGGWGAGNFSEMAADDTHRKNFCKNCLAVVKKYDLDGIDLDWEYPTSNSAGISSSPNDTKNFNYLLRDLREVLGDSKLITMASSANAKYVDFKTAIQFLDFVNIMTYDMGKPPYHNAGLYASTKTKRSCDESIELHYKAGVPYDKIVLGIPFFGHGNGVEFTSETIDYNEIKFDGYTKCWDDKAMVPYLTNSSGDMVLSYDDEVSVGMKADMVKQRGLKGAMYWNIEADGKDWPLSKAIASRLIGWEPSGEEPDPSIPSYLVTNAYMQKYMEEVTYTDMEFTSVIKNYPGGGPGEADIPPSVNLTWTTASSYGTQTLTISETGGWSRTYSVKAGVGEQELTNLVPNETYTYIVTASSGVIVAEGKFRTTGSIHQLYLKPQVRNARDLGGWTTTDGKTVVYRKIYRGGKVSSSNMKTEGKEEGLAQGILAELDLRELKDVPSSSYFGSSISFLAPGFESGYRSMLRDRAEGVRQCIEFIADCLRKNRPVYFHCAAGRDRTVTIAMLVLGVLGVPESQIGKDYELTYFSPADWSMYNGDYHHMRTADGSYIPAIEYIVKTGGGGTDFKKCTENYLLSIGVKQSDIDDIRRLMLK